MPLQEPVVQLAGGGVTGGVTGGGVTGRGRHWPLWQVVLLAAAPQVAPSPRSAGLEQEPFWQTSLPVQGLLSPQPLVLSFVNTQPCCALQLSSVQGLLSVQLSCAQLKTQLPAPWHTWPAAQFCPSPS